MSSARPKIFLSYGRLDHPAAVDAVCNALHEHGFDVWQDTERIRAGRAWGEEQIRPAIREAAAVVALLGPHATRTAANSPDGVTSVCLNELYEAKYYAKVPIVPVVTVACHVPFLVNELHHNDLTDPALFGVRLPRLVADVSAVISSGQSRVRRAPVDALRPLTFDLQMERRRGFMGRDWLFRRLHTLVRDRDVRSVLITGEPGIGKSALSAELAYRTADGSLLAVHFCDTRYPESLQPDRFVTSLAYQIAAGLPEYEERLSHGVAAQALANVISDPTTAFLDGVLHPLRTLQSPADAPLLLLVDGLDEAHAGGSGRVSIPRLLADHLCHLPEWLKVVVTARPEPDILNGLGALTQTVLSADSDENRADLTRLLNARFAEPQVALRLAASGVPAEEAARRLAERAAGNFLYATAVVDAIRVGNQKPEDIARLPGRLAGLYQEFFERLFTAETFGEARAVLEVLVAAEEPVTTDQIIAASGLTEVAVRRELGRLAAFGPRPEDPNWRHALYHRSLIDWLTATAGIFAVSTTAGHTRLADAGWRQFKTDVRTLPDYSFRHLGTHLAATRRFQDLTRVPNADFVSAAVERLGHRAALSVLYGMAVALSRAEGVDYWDALVRCAGYCCEVAAGIVRDQPWTLGAIETDPDAALERIRLELNPATRTRVTLAAVGVLLQRGETDRAERVREEVRDLLPLGEVSFSERCLMRTLFGDRSKAEPRSGEGPGTGGAAPASVELILPVRPRTPLVLLMLYLHHRWLLGWLGGLALGAIGLFGVLGLRTSQLSSPSDPFEWRIPAAVIMILVLWTATNALVWRLRRASRSYLRRRGLNWLTTLLHDWTAENRANRWYRLRRVARLQTMLQKTATGAIELPPAIRKRVAEIVVHHFQIETDPRRRAQLLLEAHEMGGEVRQFLGRALLRLSEPELRALFDHFERRALHVNDHLDILEMLWPALVHWNEPALALRWLARTGVKRSGWTSFDLIGQGGFLFAGNPTRSSEELVLRIIQESPPKFIAQLLIDDRIDTKAIYTYRQGLAYIAAPFPIMLHWLESLRLAAVPIPMLLLLGSVIGYVSVAAGFHSYLGVLLSALLALIILRGRGSWHVDHGAFDSLVKWPNYIFSAMLAWLLGIQRFYSDWVWAPSSEAMDNYHRWINLQGERSAQSQHADDGLGTRHIAAALFAHILASQGLLRALSLPGFPTTVVQMVLRLFIQAGLLPRQNVILACIPDKQLVAAVGRCRYATATPLGPNTAQQVAELRRALPLTPRWRYGGAVVALTGLLIGLGFGTGVATAPRLNDRGVLLLYSLLAAMTYTLISFFIMFSNMRLGRAVANAPIVTLVVNCGAMTSAFAVALAVPLLMDLDSDRDLNDIALISIFFSFALPVLLATMIAPLIVAYWRGSWLLYPTFAERCRHRAYGATLAATCLAILYLFGASGAREFAWKPAWAKDPGVAARHLQAGDPAGAIRLLEEARDYYTATRPFMPLNHNRVTSELAAAYRAAGRSADSVELLNDERMIMTQHLGPDDFYTLTCTIDSGKNYAALHRFDEAILIFEEVLRRLSSRKGDTWDKMSNRVVGLLWRALAAAGRHADAVRVFRHEFNSPRYRDWVMHDPFDVARNLINDRMYSEAEMVARASLNSQHEWPLPTDTIFDKHVAEQHRVIEGAYYSSVLGRALLGQNRVAEAEPLLVNGYQELRTAKVQPSDLYPESSYQQRLADATQWLIDLYKATNRPSTTARVIRR